MCLAPVGWLVLILVMPRGLASRSDDLSDWPSRSGRVTGRDRRRLWSVRAVSAVAVVALVAAAMGSGAGGGDVNVVASGGSLKSSGASSQMLPAGLRKAVGQVAASSFPGPGGTVCVVDTVGVLGWWAGEGGVSAVIGSSLAGSVGFGVGAVGSGFVFDGAQSLSLSGFAAVSSSVSVEMWVKPQQTDRVQVLASRWDFPSVDDGERSFELSLSPTGSLVWSTDETTTRRPEQFAVSVPAIFDGGWHHVAATWGNGQMRVFFDGSQVGSTASQGGLLNPASSTPLLLGAKTGLGDPFFLFGGLDEPTVWGRALSAGEVAAIHGAGSAGKCSTGGVVSQQAKLTAADAAGNDRFGLGVSVDGDTAVVGAPFNDDAGTDSGSVYVFVRTGSTWTQQAKLVASDAAAGDQFGASVAISGDTAIIGANQDDDGFAQSGSAYVFVRTGSTWTQQAKLVASDPGASDLFGQAVAVSGDTSVIGARNDDAGSDSGSAYVFVRTGSTWSQQAKLTASDAGAVHQFGASVSVDAQTIVIGAYSAPSVATPGSGAAYVFVRSGSVWSQQTKLTSSDAAAGDRFGFSVALDGDTAIVGASLNDDAGASSGSAYAFVRSGSAWSQQTKLTSSDAAAGDQFGYSVGISGGTAIFGAYADGDAGSLSGSAYVFVLSGSTWSQQTKLTASDAASSDFFGYSVAVAGGTAVVGAYGDDDAGSSSGSAYVFTGL